MVPAPASPPTTSRLPWWRGLKLPDLLFRFLCQGAALLVVALLGLLVVFLVIAAWPAISTYGFGFLVTEGWHPNLAAGPRYGALPFVWGTLATSAIAMLLAVPLGVGSATYLSEIAGGRVRRVAGFLVELLAAIPSVIYGFWGYYFVVPVVRRLFHFLDEPLKNLSQTPGLGWIYNDNPDGFGLLSAGIVLAIMVLPYITAITLDVCQAVPRSQREGALALGATRWQMIWTAVLPYARPGILGSCFLALGRALGETMAVLMLVGDNKQSVVFSPLGKGATIASVIAQTYGESAETLKRSVLVELGLILLLVTIVINCVARLLIWRVQAGYRPGPSWWARLFGRQAAPAPVASVEMKPIPVVPPPTRSLPSGGNRLAAWVDWLMTGVLAGCLIVSLGPLFLILGDISWRGITAVDLSFFLNTEKDAIENGLQPGLAHALAGTLMIVGLAALVAVPIGLFAAIFLAEYRSSPLVPVVRFVGEMLGGVPSIVMGIFAYAVVGRFTGTSGWAAAFALAVMMIPIMLRSSEESLKLVPQSLRNASYALGAAHWQTVLRVAVPAALTAIVTGVFLAIARIAGETAPLLLTADATSDFNLTLNGPTPYLTYYVYNWSKDIDAVHVRVAEAAAFVLLAMVMVLNIGIRLLTGKRVVSAARAD